MAEEPIPPYVDLPKLIAKKRDFVVNVIFGAATIGMLCCVAFLDWVHALPNNLWGVGLVSVLILLFLAGVFAMMCTSTDVFKPLEGFDCPHPNCKKYIAADELWICGHCDSLNTPERPEKDKEGSSFKHWLTQGCCKCSYQPSSFICPHCGETIFLDEKRDGQHPSRAAGKKYPVAERADDWKAQIERMIAEKTAFSTITQKVCELRDAELRRIEQDQTIDQPTKNQLIEYEKQWANKKLRDLKMGVVNSK
ncbi:MAG: hypothetical protein ABSH08_03200 [Tepidisphaeraceae bacterium]|jgi:hypothetical protein